MKLLRHGNPGQEKPGILINGKRKDLSGHFHDWDRQFFNQGGLDQLAALIQNGPDLPDVPEEARWGACVARPGKVLCIGLNYSDHAKESGMDIPEEQILFQKAANTVVGPFDPILIPKGSQK